MKKMALIIFALVWFSSCKEEKPNLPAEYDLIKGEWVAYETEVSTTDHYGGYIDHTKPVTNYQSVLYFKEYSYEYIIENISREHDLSGLYLRFTSDTNFIIFSTSVSFYYYKDEDIIRYGNGFAFFFPEISYSEIIGGNTYYRRVQ